MFLSIHDEHMFQPLKAFNEVLLGILFNGTMEISISVIALFVFYQSTKNLR